MSVNKVIIVGRLGQDPELRMTATNQGVCNFSVATSESWTDKMGQKQERTEWHRVVVWGKLADLCHQYLKKGRQVYLEGKLQTRSWDDQNGQKRYTTEVQAQTVQFLGGQATTGTNNYDQSRPAMNNNNNNVMEQNFDIQSDSNFASDDIPF